MPIRERLVVDAPFDSHRYDAVQNELRVKFKGAVEFEPVKGEIEKIGFSFVVTCEDPDEAALITARFFPGHSVSTSEGFSCGYKENSPIAQVKLFLHKLSP